MKREHKEHVCEHLEYVNSSASALCILSITLSCNYAIYETDHTV